MLAESGWCMLPKYLIQFHFRSRQVSWFIQNLNLWWTKCQLYATNSFAIDLPQSFCFALIQFDAINFVTQLVNLMLVGDGGCISPFTFTNSNVNSLHFLFLLFKPRRYNYRSSIGRKNLEPKPCNLGLVSFFHIRTSLDFLNTIYLLIAMTTNSLHSLFLLFRPRT